MAYGHAERNLDALRQIEAQTEKLLTSLTELDAEQARWLREVTANRRKGPARRSHRRAALHRSGEASR